LFFDVGIVALNLGNHPNIAVGIGTLNSQTDGKIVVMGGIVHSKGEGLGVAPFPGFIFDGLKFFCQGSL
jgi:hypothetical protein